MRNKDIKSALKQIKSPPIDSGFLPSLRERVKMQIQAFPPSVRSTELKRLDTKQRSQSLLTNKFKIKTMIPAIISLIILLSGGGAAAASQTSLPGDILYPVKNLTEDVRLAVTLDEKAKSDLNIEFAQKRVEEIQKLLTASSTGQNDKQTQAIQKALDNFSSHLEKALSNAGNLKKEKKLNDALDAISELKSSSDISKKILESTGLKTDKKELKDKIREAIKATETTNTEADSQDKEVKDEEDHGINQSSAEGKIKAAENKIAEVENFIALKNGFATSTVEITTTSTIISVDQLDEAKAKLQEAKNAFAAGDYKKAFESARESMKKANEAKHEDRLKKLDLKDDEDENTKDDEGNENHDANATSTNIRNNEDNGHSKATSTERSSESKKSDNEKNNGKNEREDSND